MTAGNGSLNPPMRWAWQDPILSQRAGKPIYQLPSGHVGYFDERMQARFGKAFFVEIDPTKADLPELHSFYLDERLPFVDVLAPAFLRSFCEDRYLFGTSNPLGLAREAFELIQEWHRVMGPDRVKLYEHLQRAHSEGLHIFLQPRNADWFLGALRKAGT